MTDNQQKIKFAVVGFGQIGRRHAALICRHEETELVALCDILPKEKLVLEGFDQPLFDSLSRMLAAVPDLDVVSICTPNGLHAPQAIEVLNAHRHVVIEKPMGLNKAECEQVIFKALNVSKHVFCVMQNRYSPPAAWLKDVLSRNLLGEIYFVQINCYWNRDNRYYFPGGEHHPWKGTAALDGGILFTQFAHFVDIMYWLFGDIKNIEGKFHNFAHNQSTQFEDAGTVNFRFVNGGMGSFNFSTALWDKNFESSLTVIGSRGTVKIGGQYMEKVEHCHIKNYEMPSLPSSAPANDYGTHSGSADNHQLVFQNVADVLKGRKSITTNALEGLKVVEMIERIYQLRNVEFANTTLDFGKVGRGGG